MSGINLAYRVIKKFALALQFGVGYPTGRQVLDFKGFFSVVSR
jgi:hypothetical protein